MSVLQLHDPEALIRHRGVRATIAMTATFALGELVLDNANLALFGAFGAFSMLAFADFGGRPMARTRAYLVLAGVGVVLIALGTLVSTTTVVGAVLLALITFVILLATVFGGYFAAGSSAALLLFVIAVMVPAPMSELANRELGWLLATVLSIAVASVLWPVHEQAELRRAAATIVAELAAVLRRGEPPDAARGAALRGEVDELRDRYARAAIRPAGPTERDQALVQLLDQVQRAVSFATRLDPFGTDGQRTAGGGQGRSRPDDQVLADAVAASFDHTAAVLRGTGVLELSTDLEQVRDEHRSQLETWVASALRAGSPSTEIAGRLSGTFAVRILSHAALSCEADAILASGGTVGASDHAFLIDTPIGGRGPGATIRRAWSLLRPHLRPGSVAFRNALRASVALSVALVVAKAVQAEHGFWVVLGTLTVLKSSAMRTGITAVQALAGNVIGFVVAAIVLALAGDSTAALWALLPVTVFLAAYAPAAVHFVVGQASFALMVVILFNILDPVGWRTGLVRVESVALGAVISLAIGIVFWPRGNRRAMRAAAADLYRSVSVYLAAGFAAVLDPDGSTAFAVDPARADAAAAEARSDAALFDLLATPTAASVPLPAWVRITSLGRSLRLVGDGVASIPRWGFIAPGSGPAGADIERLADQRVAAVAAIGDRIDRGGHAAGPERGDVVAGLGQVDPDDESAINRAIGLVWVLEWMQYADLLVGLDDEPVDEVSRTVSTPWWR